MHIVCVCGLGMGSSLILKMTVDKALKELNVTGHDIEHWDAGTVDSRNADLIVTSADFESRFAGRDNVVYVTNVVNKEEVKGKLKAYLESHGLM
jgi:PTS system ascorbate-specific IIB component